MSNEIIDFMQSVVMLLLIVQVQMLKKEIHDCTRIIARILPIILKLCIERGMYEESHIVAGTSAANSNGTS